MKEFDNGYKICPVCGTKNEANALYCKKCFYDLSTVPVIKDKKFLKLISPDFSILITKDTIIGRTMTGKKHLKDKEVSRKHLKIFWKNGTPYAQDLNSTNGTFINNQKMTPMKEYPLYNEDKINITNKYEFIVKLQNLEDETVKETIEEENTYQENSCKDNSEKTLIYNGPKNNEMNLENFKEINGYKIKKHLAMGGESDTYLVEKNGIEYVLKIYKIDLAPDMNMIENIKKITHQNRGYLVELIEFWKDNNKYYEIYEYCKHGNLADFLKSDQKKIDFTDRKNLFKLVSKINNGLKILHKNEILHRDLKPSNILIKEIREDFEIVLSDFGIAKNIKSSTVYTKNFKGTYKYSAPETLSNQYTKKSDYWSLGIIVYEIYFKKNPFEGMDINSVFSEILSEKPLMIPSKDVNFEVLTLLHGLLEKNPHKRWGSEEVDNFLKNIDNAKKEENIEKDINVLKEEPLTTWEEYGFSPLEQKEWSSKGFLPKEAHEWKEIGFNVSDALFLKSLNIEPEEAEYAKKEGLSISEMKILKIRVRCLIQSTKAHRVAVKSVSYSQIDSMLASGGNDYKLKLWNEIASKNYATLEQHTDYIECVAFSPDGKLVASASRDKSIKLWDLDKKECIDTLEGHDSPVECISFSPDGKFIVSGGWDTKVILWNVKKSKIIDIYNNNLSHVYSVTFSKSGKYVASGSEDGTIYIWDIQKKDIVFKSENNYPVTAYVAFHPQKDNLLACTGENGKIFIWDIESQRIFLSLENNNIVKTSLCFDKSGDFIAAGGEDGSIILWDINSRNNYTVLRRTLDELSLDKGSTAIIKNGNQIEIWDKLQKKIISTIKLASFAINSVAFGNKNRFLACASNNGYIQIWESYLPTIIKTIFQNGFSINEYFKWLEKGYGIDEAKIWKEKDFDVVSATKWRDGGFLPSRAREWITYGFTLEKAKVWKALNFMPSEAASWVKDGVTIEELHEWMDAGFSLEEAREWIINGFSLEEAKKWHSDNIAPQKAKKYRKFGIIGHFLAKIF